MGSIHEARENHVKKEVVEALRSEMKQKARQKCKDLASKYAECSYGRTISVVLQCRQQAKEFNECFRQWTNDDQLEKMKIEYMLGQDGKAPAKV
ncbi:hypothetical protein ACFX13_024507 [Malus domestica]